MELEYYFTITLLLCSEEVDSWLDRGVGQSGLLKPIFLFKV